ncbi:MAG: hypothetical protein ACRYGP_11005 [Janthinobacterium lividum]
MAAMTSAIHMRRLGLVVMACFVGAPLLAVPMAAQGQALLRPLTINRGLHIVQAFGPDDEDCVFELRRVPRPGGQLHTAKKLVCND